MNRLGRVGQLDLQRARALGGTGGTRGGGPDRALDSERSRRQAATPRPGQAPVRTRS